MHTCVIISRSLVKVKELFSGGDVSYRIMEIHSLACPNPGLDGTRSIAATTVVTGGRVWPAVGRDAARWSGPRLGLEAGVHPAGAGGGREPVRQVGSGR
ncbi:hypothetical protein NL676_024521 [Syzygium grande]|nr:hypothetical protein NL676_024521 [Syzygium grande]